jgi:hypothetical protein
VSGFHRRLLSPARAPGYARPMIVVVGGIALALIGPFLIPVSLDPLS